MTYEMAFRGIGRGKYELAVEGNVATGSWEWGSKSGKMRFVRKSGGSPLVVTTKGMMRKVIRFNKDSVSPDHSGIGWFFVCVRADVVRSFERNGRAK